MENGCSHTESQGKEIVKYRESMANFLCKSIKDMDDVLSLMDVDDPFKEYTDEEIKRDPLIFARNSNYLLMKKAKFHVIAVLRASQSNNFHSLAVQMRPALECVGQVVFTVGTIIAEEPSSEYKILNDLFTDYYDTTKRWTRGKNDPVALLNKKYKQDPIVKEILQKIRGRKVSDSVKSLKFGTNWYRHLSECFYHSDLTALRNISYYGGVRSCNSPLDQFFFACFLDYLAYQTLVMILYSTLCAHPTLERDNFFEKMTATLEDKNSISDFYRDLLMPHDSVR